MWKSGRNRKMFRDKILGLPVQKLPRLKLRSKLSPDCNALQHLLIWSIFVPIFRAKSCWGQNCHRSAWCLAAAPFDASIAVLDFSPTILSRLLLTAQRVKVHSHKIKNLVIYLSQLFQFMYNFKPNNFEENTKIRK